MIAKQYDFLDCVGSTFNRAHGRFTGSREIVSHDKKAALESLIKKHDLTTDDSYAIGDTHGDVGMMSLVEHPIAFNPNRRLYDQAIANKWPIVVERKNVVYELSYQNDRYVLA